MAKPDPNYMGKLGERSTSDVIVRLRTVDGRDDWFYSHSGVLTKKSKHFSTRLSDDWPTCHLLDSRNCVELVCNESDIDYHVTLLRLLYVASESIIEMFHTVKNALGILKVAVKLGCDSIVTKCVHYLEAMPWEENEEDEILKIIPSLGAEFIPVLARLQPVGLESIRNVFLSAVRVATLSEIPLELATFPSELKASAQEQVEYMLVEDDDSPLLVADDEVKLQVKKYFVELLEAFKTEMLSLLLENTEETQRSEDKVLEKASDLVWASRILPKLGLLKELVTYWTEATDEVMKVLRNRHVSVLFWETKLKVVELTGRVIEGVAYGSVILPSAQRTHLVNMWLPYIREIKPQFDLQFSHEKMATCMDGELCQTIEAAFVSLILSLPSGDQAEILADWLQTEHAQYPDLSEAFEVWCYRTKAAKRRLGMSSNGMAFTSISSVGR